MEETATLYGAKDQIIPAAPTEAVIRALDGHARVKRYDHGYHMLMRDLEVKKCGATCWTGSPAAAPHRIDYRPGGGPF